MITTTQLPGEPPSIRVRPDLIRQLDRRSEVAIIMPILNEGDALAIRLKQLIERHGKNCVLVIVDGGSHDASEAIARRYADIYVRSARGRAAQMNAGADALLALNIHVKTLLFLHADTELPRNALDAICQKIANGDSWGRFDVQIVSSEVSMSATSPSRTDHQPWSLMLVSQMMNWRSRLTSIATGDQAIFVLRKEFEAVGGYAPQALMEDIALSKILRSRNRPANLREKVRTSGRRWETHGVLKTILIMWRLRFLYFRGADPNQLATAYGYQSRAVANIAVMAKAPIAGEAKTRLIPLLGPNGAARAHRQMLLKTLATARWASIGTIKLWCASHLNHRLFRLLNQRFGVPLVLQPSGDLGVRMGGIANTHFAQSPNRPLIIVGTDCPYLEPKHFEVVAQNLQNLDVVLIGANDGGYVLIGMRRYIPEIFTSISWSTHLVLQQTIAQLNATDCRFAVIESLDDIDTPDDWQTLPRQRVKLFPDNK